MKNLIRKTLSNLSLHRTNALSNKPGGKFLYIESDDWGMLRMRSTEVKSQLIKKGYKIQDCVFNAYDRLENNDDIQSLMDVLHSVQDCNGRPGLMILNNIVGNPDFQKIENSGFDQYHYQCFTSTYDQYGDTGKVMELFREGIRTGSFLPQFHGREHVHVNNWMADLRTQDKRVVDGFQNGMFSVTAGVGSDCKKEYLDAMAIYNEKDLFTIRDSIEQGLNIFKDIWGFPSKSAIAPCYIWNNEVEDILAENNVNILQSGRAQVIPGRNKNFVQRRVTGERNTRNQMYTVRNVRFEPSTNKELDWVDFGLAQIKNAFLWGAPAIINSHRVNYIGSLDPANRYFGLTCLKRLLTEVKRYWPDVQFVHPFIQ